jgi:hypothetical protein
MKEQLKKTKKILIKKTSPQGSPGSPRGPLSQLVLGVIVLVFLASAYSIFSGLSNKVEEISVSELAQQLSSGLVSEIKVTGTISM